MMIPYTHASRRYLRAAKRFALSGTHRAVQRAGQVIPSYWWSYAPNFGDEMTPWLLPKYGYVPVLRAPGAAQFIGAGSVLSQVPETFEGIVWGSGVIRDEPVSLPGATYLAVRGPSTADCIGLKDPVFGDPGLLASRRIRPEPTRWELGFVPHHSNFTAPEVQRFIALNPHIKVIDVQRSARAVSREISACATILSSSLHGMIIADSFGIPASWTTIGEGLIGGKFKFLDYAATVTPGRTRFIDFDSNTSVQSIRQHAEQVDASLVKSLSDGLEISLKKVPTVLPSLPRYPFGLFDALKL